MGFVMHSLMTILPGQKTYIAALGMIAVGIVALIAPDTLPGIDAAQMIGTGVVALFIRMGIAKSPRA